MVLVSIDGNIGAGKSTVIHYLKNRHHYDIDLEPVDDWLPFLQDMYKNNKDAFEFQVKVWLDRIYNAHYSSQVTTIAERSGFFQWNVFSKVNFDNGKLNGRQYTILKNLYDKQPFHPDIYIYLQTHPSHCYKRIHKRSRNCESDIKLEYITALHQLHENAYELLQEEDIPHVYMVQVEGKTAEEIGEEIHQLIQQATEA